jgi:transcription initiation factor TFIIIB Brf1 subunit/transcription initiation factor TFIIB
MNCPDCGSKVVQRSSEKLCSRCGLVLQEDYFCGRTLLV